ncbi:hypothetical protein [Piscirickettsia salmonis]|uniref:hypothetical protein n=1 Tax=Piscirickettsia salmonis TaxID=1238 RepID=UPI0007C96C08|nr:hypothetical protein A0O36_01798 [Piscirickettsiaceae bacterium NZ-RLO1]
MTFLGYFTVAILSIIISLTLAWVTGNFPVLEKNGNPGKERKEVAYAIFITLGFLNLICPSSWVWVSHALGFITTLFFLILIISFCVAVFKRRGKGV